MRINTIVSATLLAAGATGRATRGSNGGEDLLK